MSTDVEAGLDGCIRYALEWSATPPQQRQDDSPVRWTLKRLVHWVNETFNIECCRETVRKCLKKLGFSWKKARKLLNKANPEKRKAYLETLKGVLEDLLFNDQHLVVFIDEAHILNLGVAKSHWRQGVARDILRFSLKKLLSNGMKWATLEVRPSNVPARSLYRSFGFSEIGRRPNYYSDNAEDAIILSLALVAEDSKAKAGNQ